MSSPFSHQCVRGSQVVMLQTDFRQPASPDRPAAMSTQLGVHGLRDPVPRHLRQPQRGGQRHVQLGPGPVQVGLSVCGRLRAAGRPVRQQDHVPVPPWRKGLLRGRRHRHGLQPVVSC